MPVQAVGELVVVQVKVASPLRVKGLGLYVAVNETVGVGAAVVKGIGEPQLVPAALLAIAQT